MQYLNENIKNQYKQRLFESILNENIQIDEQVGPIRRGLQATGRGLGRVLGKPEPYEILGKTYQVVKNPLTGKVEQILVNGQWISFQSWYEKLLQNLQRGEGITKLTWTQPGNSLRDRLDFYKWLHQNYPGMFDVRSKAIKDFWRYLPAVAPGLPGTGTTPQTDDPQSDPNSGGWSYDPITAPYTA